AGAETEEDTERNTEQRHDADGNAESILEVLLDHRHDQTHDDDEEQTITDANERTSAKTEQKAQPGRSTIEGQHEESKSPLSRIRLVALPEAGDRLKPTREVR